MGSNHTLVRRFLLTVLTVALLCGLLPTTDVPSHTLIPVAHAAATSLAPMPRPRGVPAVVTVGSQIYVMGGLADDGATNLQTMDAYDTATDSWIPKPSMQVGRGVTGAAIGADGRIYIAGGNVSSGVVEAYDLTTSTWQTLSAPLTPNRTASAVVADAQGRIFVLGGYSDCCGDTRTRVEMYDVNTGVWTVRRPMPVDPGWINAALGPDGAIYIVGGQNSVGGGLASMNRYDPVTDTWTPRAPMLTKRIGPAVTFGPNGHLYASGGFDSGESLIAMEEYNPATDTWVARKPSPEGRFGHRLVSIAGKLYTIGGTRFDPSHPVYNTPSITLMAYDIDTDTWIPDRTLPTISRLRINNGADTTNSLTVTLSIEASDVGDGLESMSFSNNGGPTWSDWQPYAPTATWTMTQRPDEWYGVSARVRDRAGNVSAPPVQRVIRLDQAPPTGSVIIPSTGSAGSVHAASPTRNVQLTATDNLSSQGQMQMRLSNRPDFAGAIWKPFASSVTWDFTGGATVYAQFKDGAGNISQTYSQSVAGSPSGGTSPAPSCSPRPRVNVHTEVAVGVPEAGGAMRVTVTTSGANNGLRAVRFDSFSNAIVHAGSQQNQTTPFAVSIPPGQEPTSLVFFVQRQTPGQSTTVRLVVVDGCGEWSTLVGGGPNAF